ncbi:hypothetical protein HMI56_001428 [Coelomomyces lativittatus]|nr:hypothetical protein HMI56_001428 [Coelomomyces lativittatus]
MSSSSSAPSSALSSSSPNPPFLPTTLLSLSPQRLSDSPPSDSLLPSLSVMPLLPKESPLILNVYGLITTIHFLFIT